MKLFCAIFSLLLLLMISLQAKSTLFVEIKSSQPITVQVYYSLGSGLSEANSAKANIKGSGDFELIKLLIPADNVKNLRFDPLEKSGYVEIRSINLKCGDSQTPIPLNKVTPINEIKKIDVRQGVLYLETLLDATDPQLNLPLENAVPQPQVHVKSKISSAKSLMNHLDFRSMEIKDIVSSQIVLSDGNKALDYFYMISLWFIILILLYLTTQFKKLERLLKWLSPIAAWITLPLTIIVGSKYAGSSQNLTLWVSAISILCLLILRKQCRLDADRLWVSVLGPWAIYSATSGILSLASFTNYYPLLSLYLITFSKMFAPMVALSGVFATQKHVRRIGFALSAVTPIGLLCALPHFSQLGISSRWTHHLFSGFVILVFIVIVYDHFRYARLDINNKSTPYRQWIWLAIPATLLPTVGLPNVSPDFFHFGEIILPFHQWWLFGQGPYEGFTAVQYGHSYLPGALNQLLFGGGASTFNIASIYTNWILVTASSFILLSFCQSPYVIILSLIFTGNVTPQSWGLIFSIICLFSIYKHRDKKINYLVSTPLGVLFCLLWHPSTSIPLAGILTTALLLYVIRPTLLNIPCRKKYYYNAILVLLFLLFLVYVSYPILKLASENSFTNAAAHGIQVTPILKDNIFFEFSRFSFIFVSALAIFQALYRFDSKSCPWPKTILVFFSMMILAAGLIYGGNRIDPGHPSRAGIISMFSCALWCFAIYPLLHVNVRNRLGALIISILVFSFYLKMSKRVGSPFALPDPIQRTVNRINAGSSVLLPAQNLHAPGLGSGYFTPAVSKQVASFGDAIEKLNLASNQTWFDLTNNQALYAFFDKQCPAPYSATFNVVNINQSKRMIGALKATNPPLTLIAPSINHEGVSPSLRSYGLYKWTILRGGKVSDVNNFTFIDHREIGRFSADDIGKLSTIFDLSPVNTINDLRKLPLVWGRSLMNIKSAGVITDAIPIKYQHSYENMVPIEDDWYQVLFQENEYLSLYPDVKEAVQNGLLESGHAHYEANGWKEGRSLSIVDHWPVMKYQFTPGISGINMEFLELVLDFELYDNKDIMNLDIRWNSEGVPRRSTNPLRLVVQKGKSVLIPLGSFVEWFASENISEINFFLPDCKKIKKIRVLKFVPWKYGI